jgi:hypothetical protein
MFVIQFKNFSPSDHDLPCNDVIGEYFMTSSLILPSSSGSKGPRKVAVRQDRVLYADVGSKQMEVIMMCTE